MIGWIIFFVVFIGMIISLILIVWKLKTVATGGVPPNSKLYVFFGTRGTKGHALGVELKSDIPDSNAKDFKLVTCKPLDIPYNHRGKPILRENFEASVPRNYSIDIPAGANSLFRNFCFVFPPLPTELPPEMRNNPLGKSFIFTNTYLGLTDKAIKYLDEHECTIKQALASVKQTGDNMFLAYKKELERVLEDKVKEKSSTNEPGEK